MITKEGEKTPTFYFTFKNQRPESVVTRLSRLLIGVKPAFKQKRIVVGFPVRAHNSITIFLQQLFADGAS